MIQPAPGEPLTEEGSGGSASDSDDGDSAIDRSVVVTASVSLSDPDPLAVADDVQALTEAAGGRIDRRNDSPSTGSSGASAELVLRIPSDELDAAISEISDRATVVSSSVDRRDVTGSVADVTARIGALDASIDRLLELLDGAGSTGDLITIESELTARQAERDSLAAQQTSLADQVEYSTVTVIIGVPGEAGATGPGDFWGGLALGFSSLGAFLSGLMVALGVVLPWILLLALVAAIVWWTRRRRRAGGRPPEAPDHAGNGTAGPVTPPARHQHPAPDTPAREPSARDSRSDPAPTPAIPPRPPLPASPPSTATDLSTPEPAVATSAAPTTDGTRTATTPAPAKARPATVATAKGTTAKGSAAKGSTSKGTTAKKPTTRTTGATPRTRPARAADTTEDDE
jgi:hypothetical protein